MFLFKVQRRQIVGGTLPLTQRSVQNQNIPARLLCYSTNRCLRVFFMVHFFRGTKVLLLEDTLGNEDELERNGYIQNGDFYIKNLLWFIS